ncbi:MAG: hypothetical protein OXI75_05480 [Rhodospirillales bacterium]|nr:hypothetical protein [Rhodospirillales bacterium]
MARIIAPAFGMFLDRPAGIAAFRHETPAFAQPVHVRQNLDRPVRRHRMGAQALLQFDDVALLDRRDRHLAECRQNIAADHAADMHLRVRLQSHRDMLFQISGSEIGDRRAVFRFGGERQG